jgi:hypothetical protein
MVHYSLSLCSLLLWIMSGGRDLARRRELVGAKQLRELRSNPVSTVLGIVLGRPFKQDSNHLRVTSDVPPKKSSSPHIIVTKQSAAHPFLSIERTKE